PGVVVVPLLLVAVDAFPAHRGRAGPAGRRFPVGLVPADYPGPATAAPVHEDEQRVAAAGRRGGGHRDVDVERDVPARVRPGNRSIVACPWAVVALLARTSTATTPSKRRPEYLNPCSQSIGSPVSLARDPQVEG